MAEHHDFDKLATAAGVIWQQIAHDILEIDPEIEAETAIEVCFDAGRLQQHNDDLHGVWLRLCEEMGYRECLRIVAQKFNYI